MLLGQASPSGQQQPSDSLVQRTPASQWSVILVERTAHSAAILVQDVQVDHRRPQVAMSEQLLDRAGIVIPPDQKLGGEGMALMPISA